MILRRSCPRCHHPRAEDQFDPEADSICRRCQAAGNTALEHLKLAELTTTELNIGHRRVLLIQKLDNLIRLTSGERIDRTAVRIGGTVCVPVASLPELVRTVRRLVRHGR